MVFAHDTELSLQAAVVLANSGLDAGHADRPSTSSTRSTPSSSYTGRHDGDRAELDRVRAIRPSLYELLTADRDTPVELVNAMLAEAGTVPQPGAPRRLGLAPARASRRSATSATRIVVETAMAMIDVIRSDEMSRLGVCADDTAAASSLDLSRNRSRRFCSTACGNRNAVAAYRARQSKD